MVALNPLQKAFILPLADEPILGTEYMGNTDCCVTNGKQSVRPAKLVLTVRLSLTVPKSPCAKDWQFVS